MRRNIIAMTIGVVLLGAAVYAAFLLRTALNLVAGEDPSVSAACPAAGDARWDGVTARISLENMDPARFPAGAGCQTEARIGGITRTGIQLAAVPSDGCIPIVPTTSYTFTTAAVVRPGDRAQLRIRCVDAAGVRHETQYAGVF